VAAACGKGGIPMAYHSSAFCDRRRPAYTLFVSIGLAVTLLIVPWLASSASGATSSPKTSVLIPSNGATLSGTTATLDASATNATSVEFRLFGGSFGFNAPVLCTATLTYFGWYCGWNSTTVPNGSYLLLSEAFNGGGSTFSSGVSITVKNSAIAFVTNESDGTVTPIDTATNTAGTPITGVVFPWQIAITPNGASAYATDLVGSSVTPINLITSTAGTPINVGSHSLGGVAITPDGSTAYVADNFDATVVPIDTATNTTATPIKVGKAPLSIAVTPNGATAYVTNNGDGTVTPINTASNLPGSPIPVGSNPYAIAITPNGATAYVTGSNAEGDFVTPINLTTNIAGTPIQLGGNGFTGIAIAPNGATAYVANTAGIVTPIAIATNTAEAPIAVANQPLGIAITPDGTTAYVSTAGNNTVTPIDLATNMVETPIGVGSGPFGIAIG
jgi:YVTN family beta-propeller protein